MEWVEKKKSLRASTDSKFKSDFITDFPRADKTMLKDYGVYKNSLPKHLTVFSPETVNM